VAFEKRAAADLDDRQYANRNGVYRSLIVETDRNEIEMELKLE